MKKLKNFQFTRALIQGSKFGELRLEERLIVEALTARGLPHKRFSTKHLKRRQLQIDRETLFVGDVSNCLIALKILGLEPTLAPSYPEELEPLLGRRVWQTSLGTFLSSLQKGDCPVSFVKPAREKLFTGRVVKDSRDLALLDSYSDLEPVYCSELIDIASEYRVYVSEGRLGTVAKYSGKLTVEPDGSVIEEAISLLSSVENGPVSYSLGFAVTEEGKTLLLEMNDGFALGAYEIGSEEYFRLVASRWRQFLGAP